MALLGNGVEYRDLKPLLNHRALTRWFSIILLFVKLLREYLVKIICSCYNKAESKGLDKVGEIKCGMIWIKFW